MRLKSKTYGLFLASLGHILAPLPFLSAAHATENKIEACGSLFSSQSPLDLHKAFQFQTLTDHTNKQIYNYAMNRSQMYTRGLVFIGADNAADARSLFSTFKAGDRLRFHGIYSLDERSEHYIGKTVHSLHELEMLTQMAWMSQIPCFAAAPGYLAGRRGVRVRPPCRRGTASSGRR